MDPVAGQPAQSERQPVAGHEETPQPQPARRQTVESGTAGSLAITIGSGPPAPKVDASCCTARIHFATDSAKLDAASKPALTRAAACLRARKMGARIAGNTDERGSAEYNMALGKRRAQSVASFLETQGVSKDKLQLHSYGFDRPVCSNGQDPSCQADNRRTEITPRGGEKEGSAAKEGSTP
jgi:outer membrane protein OmpA-like peptidoglycan-associated protein